MQAACSKHLLVDLLHRDVPPPSQQHHQPPGRRAEQAQVPRRISPRQRRRGEARGGAGGGVRGQGLARHGGVEPGQDGAVGGGAAEGERAGGGVLERVHKAQRACTRGRACCSW